jgi:hypothetical protein
VAGVRLADIMDAAGIDLNSIETFYFWTRDKQSDYYTSYSKTALIDTPRYCYYSLPDNFDDEEGTANDLATSYGEPVDTVIALADDWNRTIAGATFGSDYLNLNTNTRFRLVFGQTDAVTHTANRSAKWIHEIVVELGGAPTITLDTPNLEGEVGSVLRTEAGVTADSAVIENEAVTWTSADESIATVDENGNITIVGEGETTVTAQFAGATATVTVTGKSGGASSEPENPAGGDTGNGNEAQSAGENENSSGADNSLAQTVIPSEDVSVSAPVQALIPVTVSSATAEGGVQNWREDEMADTAEELGNVETDASAAHKMGVGLALLFIAAGCAYAVTFYASIGGRKTR